MDEAPSWATWLCVAAPSYLTIFLLFVWAVWRHTGRWLAMVDDVIEVEATAFRPEDHEARCQRCKWRGPLKWTRPVSRAGEMRCPVCKGPVEVWELPPWRKVSRRPPGGR
jgi:hypothetical protein